MKKVSVVLTVFGMLFLLTTACAKKNLQDQSSIDQQGSQSGNQSVSMQPAPGSDVASQDLLDAQARQKALEQEQEQAQAQQAAIQKFLDENIYFDFDSASLRADAQALLRAKAEYLEANRSLASLTIEGHTDDRGTDAYNMALGAKRAEAVKQFLVDLGLAPNRFNTISYGEEKPLDPGQTEEAWAKNRRANFRLNQ